MKTAIITIFFAAILTVFSQSMENNIHNSGSPVFRNISAYFSGNALKNNSLQSQDNDLIIGANDPNEVVTITGDSITGDYFLDGNITIVNSGVLNIDTANFRINGDIVILGSGQMNINGGNFTVVQDYMYEHSAVAFHDGTLKFSGVNFKSSGQSWSVGFADSAQYILENCKISDGFITTGFMGKATGVISNTKNPGEFLCFGTNNLEISNSDFLLMWLVLPNSSIVKSSLPGDSLINGWKFSDAEPDVDGIPYSLSIDNSTNVMWGLISSSGSDAVFSDTEFRTAGLMFKFTDSIAVNNITNNSTHTDDLIDIPDRALRLINSKVDTWSFYPSAQSNISVNNSVFGELLGQDSSKSAIYNSVCDGSGGYLGALHKSTVLVIGSLIKSQVIARDNSFLFGSESSFWGTDLNADESAVMFLANTATAVEPQARQSAMIFEAKCLSFEALVNDMVPVKGTARIIKGPLNPIELTGYAVDYSIWQKNPDWNRISGINQGSVADDTLAVWDTKGLAPGNYAIKLTLFHSYGDSISIGSSARLSVGTSVAPGVDDSYDLADNAGSYPNPFSQFTTINYKLSNSGNVVLKVYDVMGNEVAELANEFMEAGSHRSVFDAGNLPAGIYYYTINNYTIDNYNTNTGRLTARGKLILVR